jgi:hypothetical protein
MPWRATNERTHRPAKVASSRWTDARIPWTVSALPSPLPAVLPDYRAGRHGRGARAGQIPVSAAIRPDAIASTSAWWSRSVWSA